MNGRMLTPVAEDCHFQSTFEDKSPEIFHCHMYMCIFQCSSYFKVISETFQLSIDIQMLVEYIRMFGFISDVT